MTLLETFDVQTMKFVNQMVGAHPSFDNGVRIAADWYFLRCAPMIAAVWWFWFGVDRRNRRTIVSGVAAASIAALAARSLQAWTFVHLRPFNLASEYSLHVPTGIKTDWGAGSSFPSDTTTLHVALATLLFLLSRRAGIVAFVWTGVMIALPRVYLTYHWPSDIIAGSILGVFFVIVAQKLKFARTLSDFVANQAERTAPVFYATAFLLMFQITSSFEDIVLLAKLAPSILR